MNVLRNKFNPFNALLFAGAAATAVLHTYLYAGSWGFLSIALSVATELIIFLFFMRRSGAKTVSFAVIFAALLALFHFGQVFLCALGDKTVAALELRIVLKYFEDAECLSAMRLINISFVCICAGIIFVTRPPETLSAEKASETKSYSGLCTKGALAIILLTFPAKVFLDLNFFRISFSAGFSEAVVWYSGITDTIRTLANLSVLGFGILIVSLAGNKRKQTFAFLFIVLYLAFQIISGRRSETVSYIVILGLIFFRTRFRKKIKPVTVVVLFILAYLFLTLMYTTVRLRDLDERSIGTFFGLFFTLLTRKNVLFEAFREYGNTGYTPVCVLENWLDNYLPSFGKSYIYGITAVLPNIGGLFGKLVDSSTYGLLLQQYEMVQSGYPNIGGSVIGELFFNFGKLGGILASPLLGMLIGKIGREAEDSLENGNALKIGFWITPMFAALYWIRDYFGSGIREAVWGMILWFFISRLIVIRGKSSRESKSRILVVLDSVGTGGISTAFLNFVSELSRRTSCDILVFNEESVPKERIPENVNVLSVGNFLSILGKTQRSVTRQSPFLGAVRLFFVATAKVFGGRAARRLLFLPFGELKGYAAAISYTQDVGRRTLTRGCNDYVLQKVEAGIKCAYIHCDYRLFGGYHPGQEKTYSKFDYVLCPSEGCRRGFAECFPALEGKTLVLGNFTDVPLVRRLADEETPPENGCTTVVTVARIAKEKGIPRALGAAERLAREGYRFRWVIVGDGEEYGEVERLTAEKGLGGFVGLVGEKKNPYPYMKNADVFLLPSYHEAAPMVLGECRALGIPVISTETSSAREMLEKTRTGIVCENSEEGIYLALKAFLDGEFGEERFSGKGDVNEGSAAQLDGFLDLIRATESD